MIQLHKLPPKSPLYAVAAVVVLVGLSVLVKTGVLDSSGLAVTIMGFVAAGSGYATYAYHRKLAQRERVYRQLRFVADRFQAMLNTLPGGFCLFSPQGLLREEHGVLARLGVTKLGHFDDLVAGVKEGPELIAAFRGFQQTGEDFDLPVTTASQGTKLHIAGRRFRIGRDGPLVDVLWFSESGTEVKIQRELSTLAAKAQEQAQGQGQGQGQGQDRDQEDMQALADAIPFPVWGRDKELKIVLCNKAYAKALDASVQDVLSGQHELMSQTARGGSGKALAAGALSQKIQQKERRHVIIAGKRRLLEITELPYEAPGDIKASAVSAIQNLAKPSAATSPASAATTVTQTLPQTSTPQTSTTTSATATAASAAAKGAAAKGQVVLLGFAVDVTVEEEKDTELQRHLAAHHEVMEHLGSAIAIYGRDTRLEFYNRSYQRLWEAEESFLNGKPTFGEVLDDLRARRRIPEQVDFQRYKKERLALFTSLLEPQEDQMFLPDGTTLRILAAPHPFGGLMFVHENVTDRLALETSYNTLMAVQKETLDNLAEGIAVFGQDGRLRLFNPAFATIWKLDPVFLGKEPHIAELVEQMKPLLRFGANWPEHKSEMVGYALDRNPRHGRIERADDMVVEYLTVPLPDGAVLNSYWDVSDSVRVEQALRASNAALATADRLKSDFVANVSYQLRTPLNTIAGFADILTEQYFGTLNEKQLEYTRTIKAETDKLSRLINDVLDLATIEAGRMALNRKPVDIADLLNAAKQMTAEWARQQQLEIVIDCPTTIGQCEVDANRMKQVLFNLISNAIKYTPEGGVVTLEARRREGWVLLTVADTGIGIPQGDRDRVFNKFERANLQARQSGVGLGLSLVKSLVELHGGRIEVVSNPGKGTRIVCFIPEHPPEEEESAGSITP